MWFSPALFHYSDCTVSYFILGRTSPKMSQTALRNLISALNILVNVVFWLGWRVYWLGKWIISRWVRAEWSKYFKFTNALNWFHCLELMPRHHRQERNKEKLLFYIGEYWNDRERAIRLTKDIAHFNNWRLHHYD